MPSARHLRSLGGARPPYLRRVARPSSDGAGAAVSGSDEPRLVASHYCRSAAVVDLAEMLAVAYVRAHTSA